MGIDKIKVGILSVVLGLLVGCSSQDDSSATSAFRLKALRETALSYGAQSALAWRSAIVAKSLSENAKSLDAVYRFNAMLLENHVEPPVLAMSNYSLHLANQDTIRASDQIIEIVQPARFVTVPPSWRTYLQLSKIKPPRKPNRLLLPKNAQERDVWDDGVQVGWAYGLEQANNLFLNGLGRLNRDFIGMALYHVLLTKHMLVPPYVSGTRLGVTGGHHRMYINDEVYRITQHAKLMPHHYKSWHPVVVD